MKLGVWWRINRILTSETAYWVVQNTVGAIIPLLFALVDDLRFPLVCIALTLYGVTSTVLSNNTTIGARIVAGSLLLGAVLSGGLIGFSIVSLSWLARGSNVKSLIDVAHDLNLPEFSKYFHDTGDFYDAIDLIHKDIEILFTANSTHVSNTYWILVIVLFAVLSIPWAWVRGTEQNPLKIGVSLIGMSLTCLMTCFSLLMPVTGQYYLWSLIYGGFLKGCLVAMWGTIMSGLIVYVRSAHDELRKSISFIIRDAGKTLSHVTSCMYETMRAVEEAKKPLTAVPLSRVEHISDYDESMRHLSVKNYILMLKDLQDANKLVSSCKTEPAILGFASQQGADVNHYVRVCDTLENLISQIGCMEVIYFSIKDKIMSQDLQGTGSLDQDSTVGLRMVQIVSHVCVTLSAVLQESSDVLARMPLFQKCSGNSVSWRPKEKRFWLNLHEQILRIFEDDDMRIYLQKSGISGIKEILRYREVGDSMPFQLGGSSLVLITAVESLLDYSVQLDQRIAVALDITEYDCFDSSDIHDFLMQTFLDEKTAADEKQATMAKQSAKQSSSLRKSQEFKALMLPLMIGSGILGLTVYLFGWLGLIKEAKRRLYCSPTSTKQTNTVPSKERIVFFIKYWSATMILMLIIILVGWLAIQDSSSALYDSKELAKYLLKWMPFNAPLAAAICLNLSINTSIIKVFLRSSMIAFGGVLGFLTMLNGNLAQNGYFVFFIVLVVAAFFNLMSSIDAAARYTVYLITYTYFAVVTCQYTGKCCQAGDVWEFAGRTISTLVGAAFALLFNWLVMPLYSSHLVFIKEKDLLEINMRSVSDCLEQGPTMLHQQKSYFVGNAKDESDEFDIASFYGFISQKTSNLFKTRLSIVNDIILEKAENSLDNWRLVFIYITLIPLPLACKLAFIRIARMGIHINVCLHALKSSIYPNDDGTLRETLFSKLMKDTFNLFHATEDISGMIVASLLESSVEENKKLEIRIRSSLDLVKNIRSALTIQFESAINSIDSRSVISRRDLKCLVYFQYIYASLDEIHCLAYLLINDQRMKTRDDYLTFVVALNRSRDSLLISP